MRAGVVQLIESLPSCELLLIFKCLLPVCMPSEKSPSTRDKGRAAPRNSLDPHPAASSSMIGPNSSQRSPLNFCICNCLLTR